MDDDGSGYSNRSYAEPELIADEHESSPNSIALQAALTDAGLKVLWFAVGVLYVLALCLLFTVTLGI